MSNERGYQTTGARADVCGVCGREVYDPRFSWEGRCLRGRARHMTGDDAHCYRAGYERLASPALVEGERQELLGKEGVAAALCRGFAIARDHATSEAAGDGWSDKTYSVIHWAEAERELDKALVAIAEDEPRAAPPISLEEQIAQLKAAASDLRARLEKLTLEQAAKDQELEKYKSLAAAAGLHDACEERRGRELRNEQERWIRAEELNTRLLGCIAAVWCPSCTRRVWLEGAAQGRAQTLVMHMRRTGPQSRCGASGKTVAEALAATSDKSTIRQPPEAP